MSKGRPLQSYVATTALGLERVLGAELEALGATDVQTWGGGARFKGDRRLMIRACLWLRTAHRVRWILGHGTARSTDDLYRSIQKMARWKGLVPSSHTLRVDATARNSCFNDARFAALKTKDAIVDAVRDATGDRPSINLEDPDVSVHVRIVGERLTVGLEASGGSLHARGYRSQSGPAPLRETLAAGLLQLAEWDQDEPLFDPMCGSGTLLIEGAWMAENRPPNLDRRFGFERWPGFRLDKLASIRHAAAQEVREGRATIAGSDRDRRIISTARANASVSAPGADAPMSPRNTAPTEGSDCRHSSTAPDIQTAHPSRFAASSEPSPGGMSPRGNPQLEDSTISCSATAGAGVSVVTR